MYNVVLASNKTKAVSMRTVFFSLFFVFSSFSPESYELTEDKSECTTCRGFFDE